MNNFSEILIKTYLKFLRSILPTGKLHPVIRGELKDIQWVIHSSSEYFLGNYETEISSVFIRHCTTNSVFYDIGANFGYFSILAAALGIKKIYTFEPLPNNITNIEAHLEANKNQLDIFKINVLPIALSDSKKEVFFSDGANNVANTYVESSPFFQNAEKKIKVECESLDNLIFEQGFEPPTIIKIDVEGAEADVLKGALKTIKVYKPIIILSTHDAYVKGICEKSLKILDEQGYIYSKIDQKYNLNLLDDFLAVPKVNN